MDPGKTPYLFFRQVFVEHLLQARPEDTNGNVSGGGLGLATRGKGRPGFWGLNWSKGVEAGGEVPGEDSV